MVHLLCVGHLCSGIANVRPAAARSLPCRIIVWMFRAYECLQWKSICTTWKVALNFRSYIFSAFTAKIYQVHIEKHRSGEISLLSPALRWGLLK